MPKNELFQMVMTKEEKEQLKRDYSLLNKRNASEYVRWLVELGHFIALTQHKKSRNEYLITEERVKKFIREQMKV